MVTRMRMDTETCEMALLDFNKRRKRATHVQARAILRNGPLVTSTTLLGNRAEPDHGRPLRRADDYRSAPPLAHSSGE